MRCIFCGNENEAISIEHIVPESFGNLHYLMPRSAVCDRCNNRFSDFEEKALTKSVFVMERARFGVVTKKGSNVKGKVSGLEIEGATDFEPQRITVKGSQQKISLISTLQPVSATWSLNPSTKLRCPHPGCS